MIAVPNGGTHVIYQGASGVSFGLEAARVREAAKLRSVARDANKDLLCSQRPPAGLAPA